MKKKNMIYDENKSILLHKFNVFMAFTHIENLATNNFFVTIISYLIPDYYNFKGKILTTDNCYATFSIIIILKNF